jgi:Flp pilus assembly protein TadB
LSPEHLLSLLRDPLGVRLITIGAFLQVIGSLVIRRIVKIEY